ncbi:unnamed protein product [Caenorhabditis auriculariae]|uniref:BZIP domain-containing protein n=1 Tax=Caenorhabditis auriculariae TaxID=2777116 RepID=A0A8S1GZW6_9PELO|nr:unnamed protein product [Caenorhabditis auriculariae]
MGQNASFCYNVTRGKVITIECDYPWTYTMEDLLYRSPLGAFFELVECLLLGAMWFCNIFIRRDFAEAFLSSVAVPLSLSTVLKLACFAWNILFPRDELRGWIINILYSVTVTSAQLTLMQGLPAYLYMSMKMATSRKQDYGITTWLPYAFFMLLSFPLSGVVYLMAEPIYSKVALIAIIAIYLVSAVVILIMLGLCLAAFICFSGSNREMDMLDPVVYDGRSRLGWAVLYALLIPISAAGSIFCLVSLAYFINDTSDYEVLSNEMATRVWSFFFGPIFLLLTFLILPSYRDVLLCGCKFRKFTKKVTIAELAAPHNPQVFSTSNSASPIQPIHIINDTPQKKRNREAAKKYRDKKDNLISQLREQNETLMALLKQKEGEIQQLREEKEFQWCQCLMTQSRVVQMSGNNTTDPIANLPLESFGVGPSEEANPSEQHY